MARICFYCGKELSEGESCNCRKALELSEERKLKKEKLEKSNSNFSQVEKLAREESNSCDDLSSVSEADDNLNNASKTDNTTNSIDNNVLHEYKNGSNKGEDISINSDDSSFHARENADIDRLEKNEYGDTSKFSDVESGSKGKKWKLSKLFYYLNHQNNSEVDSEAKDKFKEKVRTSRTNFSKQSEDILFDSVDKCTQTLNKFSEQVKRGAGEFHRSHGRRILSSISSLVKDFFRGPEYVIRRTRDFKRVDKIILMILVFLSHSLLMWRIAATTSLGKFLDYANDTGMVFSFAQLTGIFARAFLLSVLFFVVRSIAYKFVIYLGWRDKKITNELIDLQLGGYIYSVVFCLLAIILAQGSGISSFFLMGFSLVVQGLTDYIYIQDFMNYGKNKSFQIIVYANLMTLLILAMFIRWVFPSISHYSVISCPWLWN